MPKPRRRYRVDEEYRNYAGSEDDKYSSWLGEPLEGGIQPPAGINPLSNPNTGRPEFFVFYSGEGSKNNQNPWNDTVNLDDGYIRYWGDAKPKHEHPDDATGNQVVKKTYNQTYGRGDLKSAPPVLFFQRERSGYVTFKGLCIFKGLQVKRYRSEGEVVPNYLFDLAILDADEVSLDWIHSKTLEGYHGGGPDAWQHWVETGTERRYSIYNEKVRSPSSQQPTGSRRDLISDVRSKLDGTTKEKGDNLEALVYLLLESMKNVREVDVTPDSGDNGVDLTGEIDLLGYVQLADTETTVDFKAQVKNWKLDSSVGGKDLSRLASRIDDGEVGLFFTTSYFTRQAQKENHSTYPVRLFAGADLGELLLQSELVEENRLREGILEEIKEVLSGSR